MVTAEGSILLHLDALRSLLAASATFQSITGAADAAEALESVHFEALPAPTDNAEYHTLAELEAYRPYAVLYPSEDGGFSRSRLAMETFGASGVARIDLTADVPSAYATDPASLFTYWLSIVGKIVDELLAASASSVLQIVRIDLVTWGRAPEDHLETMGDYVGADLLVAFGIGGSR